MVKQELVLNLKIDEILEAVAGDALDAALFAGAQVVLEAAQAKVAVDEGDTRDSGYVATANRSTYQSKRGHRKEVKPAPGNAVVGFAAFNAGWLEVGTGPHEIGKAGQLLRMPNGDVVRGPLQHPGTPAQPFLRPALDEKGGEAARVIVEELRKNLGG